MILYRLFNSLWLNAYVSLRGAGTAVLQQPLHYPTYLVSDKF
jgi:hypothetical protein